MLFCLVLFFVLLCDVVLDSMEFVGYVKCLHFRKWEPLSLALLYLVLVDKNKTSLSL